MAGAIPAIFFGGYMSHDARQWAKSLFTSRSDLTPLMRNLLWALADIHTPERGCFASNSYLAYMIGCEERCITRNLARLESVGLVERWRIGRARRVFLACELLQESYVGPVPRDYPDPSPETTQTRLPGLPRPVPGDGDFRFFSVTKASPINKLGGKLRLRDIVLNKVRKEVRRVDTTLRDGSTGKQTMNVKDRIREEGKRKTEDEILQEFQKALEKKVAPTGTMIWALWRDLVVLHHPRVFLKAPNTKELSQLKRAYLSVDAGELPKMFVSVLGNWNDFIRYCKANAGATMFKQDARAGYSVPSIGFVLRYIEWAVNFHRLEVEPVIVDNQPNLASQISPATQTNRASHEHTVPEGTDTISACQAPQGTQANLTSQKLPETHTAETSHPNSIILAASARRRDRILRFFSLPGELTNDIERSEKELEEAIAKRRAELLEVSKKY